MTEIQQIAADLGAMHERIRKASTVTSPEVADCLVQAMRELLSIIRLAEVAALIERDEALASKEA